MLQNTVSTLSTKIEKLGIGLLQENMGGRPGTGLQAQRNNAALAMLKEAVEPKRHEIIRNYN